MWPLKLTELGKSPNRLPTNFGVVRFRVNVFKKLGGFCNLLKPSFSKSLSGISMESEASGSHVFCHFFKLCLLHSTASVTRSEASRLDEVDRVSCISCNLAQTCGIVSRSPVPKLKVIETDTLSSLVTDADRR